MLYFISIFSHGLQKYTRKWEDESAYTKQKQSSQRSNRQEDFPELGARNDRKIRNNQPEPDIERDAGKSLNQSHQNIELPDSNRRFSNRPMNNQNRGEYKRNSDSNMDRGMNKSEKNDRNFKGGREFKNQNRNRGNGSSRYDEYDNRTHNKNSHIDKGHGYPSNNQYSSNYNDNEHVESVSFTNSKMSGANVSNSGENRYSSNADYSNTNKEREYVDQQDKQQRQQNLPQQRPITGRQQNPSQTSGQQLPAQIQRQNQNTLLTTNHPMPITSSVISNTMNQQQTQQIHTQNSSQSNIMNEANRPKRYSQRQRGAIDHQPQIPINEMQIHDPNILLHVQQQTTADDTQKQKFTHPKGAPQNYAMGYEFNQQIQKTPQTTVPVANVVGPNVPSQTQFPQNYYSPEYPQTVQPINPAVSASQTHHHTQFGQATPYIQSPGSSTYIQQAVQQPTQPGPVVPPMMNYAHTQMQTPPAVGTAPIVNPPAQGQYPTYPTYPAVQNYNSAVSIFFCSFFSE